MVLPVHPLVAAWVDAFAREMRVDPSMLADAIEGRPIPPWFAAALAGAHAPRVKVEHFVTSPLTAQHKANTLSSVDATTTSVLKGRANRLAKTKQAKKLDKLGLTYAEIAKRLKDEGTPYHVNTVQAWFKQKSDPHYRRIPDDAATALVGLGFPREDWPSIIPAKP